MKKVVGVFAFLFCLTLGVLSMQTTSEAATKWYEGQTMVVKKGAFTFKAHPAAGKKQAWIYYVKVDPKKGSTKTLKFPAKIKGRTVTKLGWTENMGEDAEFYKNIFNVWIEEAHDCDGYIRSLKKTQNLVIPKSVKEITNCAFSGMRSLKKVTIPSGIKKLSRSLFYGCRKLKTVNLPKKLQEFDKSVFLDCPSIKTMKISKSNKQIQIKNGAVLSKDGTRLIWILPTRKNYTIPRKVNTIAGWAFEDCEVKNLNLPATVTVLEANALYSPAMENVHLDSQNPVYAKDGQCVYDKKTGELITAIVKDDKIVISSKVTVLNDKGTMTGMSVRGELKRIDIPASVQKLVTGWMFFSNLDCKVYFHSLTPPQIEAIVPGWEYSALPCFNPVYVPAASKEAYAKWAEDHYRYPGDTSDVKGLGFTKLYTF